MRPIDWIELKAICEFHGCVYSRTKGDHYIMVKPGMARPVVFPMKRILGKTLFWVLEEHLEYPENKSSNSYKESNAAGFSPEV